MNIDEYSIEWLQPGKMYNWTNENKLILLVSFNVANDEVVWWNNIDGTYNSSYIICNLATTIAARKMHWREIT